MRRLTFLLILLVLIPATVSAGSLEPPASPDDPASAMFTLDDIYNRLLTGEAGQKRTGAFLAPGSNAAGSDPAPAATMADLNQIMSELPQADNTSGARTTDVLNGTTFWGLRTDGTWGARTGAMPDRGAQNITPGTAAQAISPGYHDGTGSVEGDTGLVSGNIKSGVTIFGVSGNYNGVDTSSGDAVAGDILAGKKAWVDGIEITGNVTVRTLSDSSTTVAAGYYGETDLETVEQDLKPWNIKKDVTIFGVTGTAQ